MGAHPDNGIIHTLHRWRERAKEAEKTVHLLRRNVFVALKDDYDEPLVGMVIHVEEGRADGEDLWYILGSDGFEYKRVASTVPVIDIERLEFLQAEANDYAERYGWES